MGGAATKRVTGYYDRAVASGERWGAFVPFDLPPFDPPLAVSAEAVARAESALARLRDASPLVPSVDWFTFALAQKEAVLTSQLEGTRATMGDVLDWRARSGGGVGVGPSGDVAEVANYTEAMAYAFDQIASPAGLPISSRLLDGAHRILLQGMRSADRLPGEARRSQNWIGGTRPGNATYVPPPHAEVARLLSALFGYVHRGDGAHSPVVRTGLVHAQFEMIHPYLDGNGRIGRLLVALLLAHWGLLERPVLYVSLALKRRRREYYDRLADIPARGDWEGWIGFFLDAIAEASDQTVSDIHALARSVESDRRSIIDLPDVTVAAIRLFELLPRYPVVSVATVAHQLGLSKPTATRAIETVVRAGVLTEQTGRARGRQWAYGAYLATLVAETELP